MRFSFPVFSQGGTDRVAVLFYVVGARRADWEPPLRMGWLRRFRSLGKRGLAANLFRSEICFRSSLPIAVDTFEVLSYGGIMVVRGKFFSYIIYFFW